MVSVVFYCTFIASWFQLEDSLLHDDITPPNRKGGLFTLVWSLVPWAPRIRENHIENHWKWIMKGGFWRTHSILSLTAEDIVLNQNSPKRSYVRWRLGLRRRLKLRLKRSPGSREIGGVPVGSAGRCRRKSKVGAARSGTLCGSLYAVVRYLKK